MEATVTDIFRQTDPLEEIEIIPETAETNLDVILPKEEVLERPSLISSSLAENLAVHVGSATSGSSKDPNESIKKEGQRRIKKTNQNEFLESCPICSDKVSGYHYGILTCESCKGFFKRTVQNKKNYQCVEKGNCLINKLQRKRCPACRYQKCLQKGMKLEAVRADRLRGGRNKFGPLYKHDRAMKQQKLTLIQNLETKSDKVAGDNSKKENSEDETTQSAFQTRAGFNGGRREANHRYTDIFHPYLGSSSAGGHMPDPESRISPFYGYPYTDPRYLPQVIPYRSHIFPSGSTTPPHLLRSMSDHEQDYQNYERLRYVQATMGQNSLNYGGGMNDNRINPIPRESLGQISDRSAVDRGDFTVPNVAGGNSDPGHPTGANFSLSQGIQLPVSDGLTQPPTIQNSPFQCSNGELIKRMVDSWIPEEDVRKAAQKAMKGTQNLNYFQIVCKVNEQILVSLVEWAKGSLFFQDMVTEDQMSLLHETWSELVLLDHIYRQVWFSNEQNILLVSGQSISISNFRNDGIFDAGAFKLIDKVIELTNRFRNLQIDRTELVCLKFLILFDAKDSKQPNTQFMNRVSERINQVLLEYVNQNYPDQDGRFLQLIMKLPELRAASQRIETWLWEKKQSGFIGPQTLMAEMLDVRFRNEI